MNVIQQLVKDEIERRKDLVADADLRVVNAKTELDQAKANAQRAHAEFDYLKAWLAAETNSPDWAS
jgi:hypothetical protein